MFFLPIIQKDIIKNKIYFFPILQEVARLIAERFADRNKADITFLVVEAKKSNLEPKNKALIFLEA